MTEVHDLENDCTLLETQWTLLEIDCTILETYQYNPQ